MELFFKHSRHAVGGLVAAEAIKLLIFLSRSNAADGPLFFSRKSMISPSRDFFLREQLNEKKIS